METDMEALMAQAAAGRGGEITIPDKCAHTLSPTPQPGLTVWQWRGHPHLVACSPEGACLLDRYRTVS